MDRTITANDLRKQLGQALEWVLQGDRVIVTRYGRPIAVLAPPAPGGGDASRPDR